MSSFTADVQSCGDNTDEFFRRVNGVWDRINEVFGWVDWFPGIGDIIKRVQDLMDQVFQKAQEIADKIAEFFSYVGDPSGLRDTGGMWVQKVGAPASSATSRVDPAVLPTFTHWSNDAYTSYTQTAGRQKPAAEEVRQRCVMIDTELGKFASAIESFWISFSLAAIALLAEVIAGILMICGVISAPVGAAAIIVAITSFLTAVVSFVTPFVQASQAATAMVTQVTNGLSNNSAFTGGAWPEGPQGA